MKNKTIKEYLVDFERVQKKLERIKNSKEYFLEQVEIFVNGKAWENGCRIAKTIKQTEKTIKKFQETLETKKTKKG